MKPLNIPPDFREHPISQMPALQLLINMGWQYVSPKEALALRGGRLSNVLLEEVLLEWLRNNNRVNYKGRLLPFTESNLLSALQALKEIIRGNLVHTNEAIYDLLTLGKSLPQSIEGDIKSYTLNYINWEQWEQNAFHVTEEYSVERTGSHETRRPDIVLFVNGIPFGIIECKSPDIKEPIKQAISQQIRNQREDEITKLFQYSQLLLAISKNDARYATTGTPAKFWAVWREQSTSFDEKLEDLINKALPAETEAKLQDREQWIVSDKVSSYQADRLITEQDRALYALCLPERLLDLTRHFILFDAGEKKIARYQQYFVVKAIMERIRKRDSEGRRIGGVVWHTQGSGKSLTMVMVANAIALSKEIPDYKMVLVTDRIDLDDQLYKTFQHCDKELFQASTGKNLSELLNDPKGKIITTVIDKFEAAFGRHAVRNTDPNIFVLVDEGHRGQYGPRHARMRLVLPNACFIGFTGTPIMKKDKNTVRQFGGIIGDSYTITKAVDDKAIVPLLYEGRMVEQDVNEKAIDTWFDKITENLSKEQSADLKRKFASTGQLNKSEQRIMAIAWDISHHYLKFCDFEGYKAQLVTPDKATALLYKKYMDDFGFVTSDVLISPPSEPEGDEDIYTANKKEVQQFWDAMIKKYGTEREYNRQIINAFKHSDHPQIIIVVYKLLTGFDAPRNTILYVDRKLDDYNLLQAIARVNRLYEGKEFGYIIDYRGVLSNLDKALDMYSTLPDFDLEDLQGTLTDVSEEIKKLPQKYSVLWDTFKDIKNRRDEEAYERLLADDSLRNRFYERLSSYARSLAIALSTVRFIDETPADKIARYRHDLKFFSKLRASVRKRYAEAIDFGEYEPKIKKLLDTHVGTGEVESLTPLINIFNKEEFNQELEGLTSTAAKADAIAHRTQRTLHEHFKERDPEFFRRFSELIRDAIKDYREQRISDLEYLKRVTEHMESVRNRTGDKVPERLNHHDLAKAYFGSVKRVLQDSIKMDGSEDDLAQLTLDMENVINTHRIVNWTNNNDIQNRMQTDIEDLLFDFKDEKDLELTLDDIDEILKLAIDIAKAQKA